MTRYDRVGGRHVAAALPLVLEAYREARAANPYLPPAEDFAAPLREAVAGLFERGIGVAALEDDRLLGFLVGWEVEALFGSCKGVYSPLYGHGAVKARRRQLYEELYRHAAALWVERACFTHAITLFAHDRESIDTWFWQGFGLRCVDAMRETAPLKVRAPGLTVSKVGLADAPALANLHQQHHLYYQSSPVFMPQGELDPLEDLRGWLAQPGHHLWAAYLEGVPVGYMRIQPQGESFVAAHPSVMNITGAYVLNEARGAGVGAALLGAILRWLKQRRYPRCGVDYEALNPLASRFWGKHFWPYSYSLVRRIDERVLA